jgi:hypothetical protein
MASYNRTERINKLAKALGSERSEYAFSVLKTISKEGDFTEEQEEKCFVTYSKNLKDQIEKAEKAIANHKKAVEKKEREKEEGHACSKTTTKGGQCANVAYKLFEDDYYCDRHYKALVMPSCCFPDCKKKLTKDETYKHPSEEDNCCEYKDEEYKDTPLCTTHSKLLDEYFTTTQCQGMVKNNKGKEAQCKSRAKGKYCVACAPKEDEDEESEEEKKPKKKNKKADSDSEEKPKKKKKAVVESSDDEEDE